jgi:hypothetical protein
LKTTSEEINAVRVYKRKNVQKIYGNITEESLRIKTKRSYRIYFKGKKL